MKAWDEQPAEWKQHGEPVFIESLRLCLSKRQSSSAGSAPAAQLSASPWSLQETSLNPPPREEAVSASTVDPFAPTNASTSDSIGDFNAEQIDCKAETMESSFDYAYNGFRGFLDAIDRKYGRCDVALMVTCSCNDADEQGTEPRRVDHPGGCNAGLSPPLNPQSFHYRPPCPALTAVDWTSAAKLAPHSCSLCPTLKEPPWASR